MIKSQQAMLPSAQTYTSMQGLGDLKRQARKDQGAALPQVAQQFESLFLQMMLKSMRAATIESGLFSNSQSEMYLDLFDKQIGLKMSAQGGLGLADLMMRQLQTPTLNANSKIQPPPAGFALNKQADADAGTDEKFLALATRLKSAAMQLPFMQTAKQAEPVHGISIKPKTFNLQYKDILPSANINTNSNANTGASKTAHESGLKSDNAQNETSEQANSASGFLGKIWHKAKSAARQLGVNPVAILAQTVLETGWGKFIAKDRQGNSSHNLFGIKTSANWPGSSLNAQTQEFNHGKATTVRQNFKVYASADASFDDYVNLLKTSSRYQAVLASGNDIDRFAKALQKSGYATDPEYGRKLMAVVNSPKFQTLLKGLRQ